MQVSHQFFSATPTLSLLSILTLLLSCGSEMSSTQRSGPNREIGKSGSSADASLGCKISSVSQEDQLRGFSATDLNSLKITDANKVQMSMCEYMEKNSIGSAVFQFAGVFCSSCQEEAKFFEASFNNKSATGVAHIIVFTDYFEDYPEESFVNFMNTYAPHALRAHDPEIDLWKHFSKNPIEPVRPTVLGVNKEGLGLLVNTEGQSVEPIYEVSFELLEKISSNNSSDAQRRRQDHSAPQPKENPAPKEEPKKDSEIPASRDFALTTAQGEAKKLSDIFTADYMLLDFSQFFCGACKQFADSHQNDRAFQRMMDGTTCQFGIAIPNRDAQSWYGRYARSSYIGSVTIGVQSQLNIVQNFGLNFSSIPYFVFINKKGEVVDQRIGGLPSRVRQMCGG